MAGAQLLTVRYKAAGKFAHDPSQIVTDVKCRSEWWRPVYQSLAYLPRGAFDYVWLLEPPAYHPALTGGMTPIWLSLFSTALKMSSKRGMAQNSMELPKKSRAAMCEKVPSGPR